MPAMLSRMSILPCAERQAETAEVMEGVERREVWWKVKREMREEEEGVSGLGFEFEVDAEVDRGEEAGGGWMSRPKTVQFRFRSERVVAWPMPEEEPVTRAMRLEKSILMGGRKAGVRVKARLKEESRGERLEV